MNWRTSSLALLAALLVVFAEAAFDLPRRGLGAQVDLLPALIVWASLCADLTTVALVSVIGGLCFDSLSANPLGATILPLFAAGFLIHLKRGLILHRQVTAQFVLGLFASAAVPVLTLLVLLSAGQRPLLGWASVWQWAVMSVAGGLLTPPLFRAFDATLRLFSHRPVASTSFRPDREIRRGRY